VTGIAQGVAFETLIYTDCRPGQGLQGTAGLQFQARSPGADRAAMSVVQRNLLYEPPPAWMRQRRPVSDYPPSFAHIHDGVYATAAGVYRGRETNGGREGNQLTHGIVTADPAAYGLVRPAQLFGAPFWTAEPAGTTSCQPVADGWEPGPFDAEAAQEFVLAEPRGADRLRALVSALDRAGEADAPRVLFIAEDPAAVLRWIVAATLLIPQQRALAIGLKVFTTNPAYAAQPVVAVHPDWESTSATVDNDSGYAVFDLVGGGWSAVEPSPAADQRVRMFCEHDPYDVVDLVEVASGTGEAPLDALELGRAMVIPDSALTERTANLAVEWLRKTDPARLAAHRGDLVDQLTAAVERWPLRILRSLDEVSLRGQVPADHVPAVRLALIRAELENAVRDHAVVDSPLAPLAAGVWQDQHQRTAEDAVVETLSRELPAPAIDAVLRVAGRFDLAVRTDEVSKAAWMLVTDWTDHPDRWYRADRWPCGPDLERMLFDELDARAGSGQEVQVGDDWWERLVRHEGTLGPALRQAIIAAAMVHAPDGERHRLVRDTIGRVTAVPGAGPAVPKVVEALWRRRPPSVAELGLLCELLPQGPVLPGRMFEPLRQQLLYERPLSRDALVLAHDLVACELFAPAAPERRLLDADRQLKQVCSGLSGVVEAAEFPQYVSAVRRADPRLVTLWSDRLADALLQVAEPPWVPPMLDVLPPKAVRLYVERLAEAVRRSARPAPVVVAFYLTEQPGQAPNIRSYLEEYVLDWISRSSGRRQKPVRAAVEELGKAWSDRWAEFEEQAKGRRWRRRPRRPERTDP
jgi:hypothetical protein